MSSSHWFQVGPKLVFHFGDGANWSNGEQWNARANSSTCSLKKEAVTAVCLCTAICDPHGSRSISWSADQRHCSAESKPSNWSLNEWAFTVFCVYTGERHCRGLDGCCPRLLDEQANTWSASTDSPPPPSTAGTGGRVSAQREAWRDSMHWYKPYSASLFSPGEVGDCIQSIGNVSPKDKEPKGGHFTNIHWSLGKNILRLKIIQCSKDLSVWPFH